MQPDYVTHGQSPSDGEIKKEFATFVADTAFPCLGAKAALNAGSQTISIFDSLGSPAASRELATSLEAFVRSETQRTDAYATFVAIFREPRLPDEEHFERLLWQQLRDLHHIDREGYNWDASVASDPAQPDFSFSFAGQALYVVGLHGASSRLARRFPWPTLVFNPHEQFERLRQSGKWRRMQESIRSRDIALQGSVNPMLSDFGERSEARQYSGRQVDEHWSAPFPLDPPAADGKSRCPFGH